MAIWSKVLKVVEWLLGYVSMLLVFFDEAFLLL